MKKKICIVTAAPHVQNYGSVAMTYATQMFFLDHGFEVEILDYTRRSLQEAESLCDTIRAMGLRDKSKNQPLLVRLITALVVYPSIRKMSKSIKRFYQNSITMTQKAYSNEEDLFNNPPDADIYCTGGDQMWNEACNFHKTMGAFYLTFAPVGKPRISFSTSIGKQFFDDWELPEVLPLLKKYNFISVREKDTAEYFNSLGLGNVYHLLDPTLLIDTRKWEFITTERLIDEDYILMYEISRKGNLATYAQKVAKETGKKLIRIDRFGFDLLKAGKPYYCPSPNEWLSLFKYASGVITNSFHGTVFSIVFRRNFVFVPGDNAIRIVDMLLSIGIGESKICRNINDLIILYSNPIDYNEVERQLLDERRKADKYINEVLTLFG